MTVVILKKITIIIVVYVIIVNIKKQVSVGVHGFHQTLIMEVKEIQTKKKEVITDVLCDCCGNSCKVVESTVENPVRVDNGEKFYDFEYMQLTANWGYHSGKDLERWTAQICEKCVDEKFSFIKFNKRQMTFKTMIE